MSLHSRVVPFVRPRHLSTQAHPAFALAGAEVDDGAVLVHLVGDLDLDTAGLLVAGLLDLCRPASVTGGCDDDPDTLLLDLSAVDFLDSAGLSAVVDCRNVLLLHGWCVRTVRARGGVAWLLQHAVDEGWAPADLLGEVRRTPRSPAPAGRSRARTGGPWLPDDAA